MGPEGLQALHSDVLMIPQAAVWIWFGIAWLFIVAVVLSRWRAREKADAAETERVLEGLLHDRTGEYIYDA